MQHNIVSISGGKDSTATLLVALALEVPNLQAVFADTGHEHAQTYEYVHYLAEATGVPIRWVKAEFSQQIARKRAIVETKWREHGVQESIVQAALEVLHPTGNPFLDLCLWKGRFPSTKVRFCTEELKRNPIIEQVFIPLMNGEDMLLSWQGVRRDDIHYATHGIDRMIEWSRTDRGGRQTNLIDWLDRDERLSSCSSAYGLCESYELVPVEVLQ